jgi:uncharacterized protein
MKVKAETKQVSKVIKLDKRRYFMKCNAIDWIAWILVIVGALNWGLVGIFHFDLVAFLFGMMSLVSRVVYILVAIAAIYLIVAMPRWCNKAP